MKQTKTHVFSDPKEAHDRLAELGLATAVFIQAVQRGHAIAAGFTPNHPPISRGITHWGEIVAAIREQLIPHGWTRDDSDNLSLTVNATKTIAISVATGDEATGNPDVESSTRSSKGPRTESAVIVNALQLTLWGNVRLTPEELKRSKGVMTFILLFHRDAVAQETRLELSRPVKMDSEGYPEVWAERIIFPPLPFGLDGAQMPENAASPEIMPEVKRKRG